MSRNNKRRAEYYGDIKHYGLAGNGETYYSSSYCHCGCLPGLRFDVVLVCSDYVTIEDNCCGGCLQWLEVNK